MGDKPDKKKAKKAKPPELPKDAPKDVADFVDCKANTLDLKSGKVGWLPKPGGDLGKLMPDPEVSFEAGAQPGEVKVKLKLGATMTVPGKVKGGKLELDTSGIPIPGLGKNVDDWVKKLNDWFESNGKKLGTPTLKDGTLSLAKEAVAAAAPAGGGLKMGGIFPGVPAGAKVAGAVLFGLSFVPGVGLMGAGDSTTDEKVACDPATDGACTPNPRGNTPVAQPDQSSNTPVGIFDACQGVDHISSFSNWLVGLSLDQPVDGPFTVDGRGPSGSLTGTGRLDDGLGTALVRINQYGTYRVTKIQLADGTVLELTLPPLGQPFTVTSQEVPCNGAELDVAPEPEEPVADAPPVDEGTTTGTKVVTETTDVPPWSLAIPVGTGLGLLGLGLAFSNRRGGLLVGPPCEELLARIAEIDRALADDYRAQGDLSEATDLVDKDPQLEAAQRVIDHDLELREQAVAEAVLAGCNPPPAPQPPLRTVERPNSSVTVPVSTESGPVSVPPDFTDDTYRRLQQGMANLIITIEAPPPIVAMVGEDDPKPVVDAVNDMDPIDKITTVVRDSVASGDAGDEMVAAVGELLPLLPVAAAIMIGAHFLLIPGLVIDAAAIILLIWALGSDFYAFVDTMNDAVKARNRAELQAAEKRMAHVLGHAGLDAVLALVQALSTIAKLGKGAGSAEEAATASGKAPKKPELSKGGVHDALPGDAPPSTGKVADVPTGLSAEEKAVAAAVTAEEANNAARAEVPIRGAIREWLEMKKSGGNKIPKQDAGKEHYKQYLDGLEKLRAGEKAEGAGYWEKMDPAARDFLQDHALNPLTEEQFLGLQ